MAAPIAVFLFIFLFAVIGAVGYKHYLKPTRLVNQLGGRIEPQGAFPVQMIPGVAEKQKPFAEFLGNLGALFPVSPQEIEFTRKTLHAAGFRKDFAVKAFYGARLLAIAIMVVFALLVRDSITENPVLRIVVVAAGGALGFYGPGYVLDHLIVRRRRKIRLALPDMLDLLVVCTEAGCALDLAILKVSEELAPVHPEICEELSLISLEMLAGKARMEALRNFATRTGDPEVKKLVAVLVQTDKFGTSVSDALRTQSDFLRTRRRQESEEKAGKVGVKLVFPIFFFCLPSLFIVTAGPGILQLIKNLFPMMKEFR